MAHLSKALSYLPAKRFSAVIGSFRTEIYQACLLLRAGPRHDDATADDALASSPRLPYFPFAHDVAFHILVIEEFELY